jgi:transposase
MRYGSVDIASVSSFIWITDEGGKKLAGGEVATEKDALQRAFRPYVKHGLKIAIEAGNQTAWIYDCLVETGAEVIVVNPNKVKLIAESRRKTDKIDAKILCELLRGNLLPRPVHMPSPEARSLRTLLNARRQLLRNRTQLCNTVRGVLRQEGVRLKARGLNSKKAWQEQMSAQYKGAHIPTILRAYYPAFEALTQSLRELNKELKLKAEQDPRVELLKTMPMVGVIAALTLIAAIDDEARFTSSRQLVSYSGLAPIVRQSGERATYGPISREGRRELRAIWVQIAHLVATDDSGPARPLRRWFLKVAHRRGKKTALVALARKLLTIALQMLKTGEVYEAKRLVRKSAA